MSVFQALDLATPDSGQIALHFALDDWDQEIETQNVRHADQEHKRIQNFKQRPKLDHAAKRDKGAENDLVDGQCPFLLARQLGQPVQHVIGSSDYRRKGKQHRGKSQRDQEPPEFLLKSQRRHRHTRCVTGNAGIGDMRGARACISCDGLTLRAGNGHLGTPFRHLTESDEP